MENKIFSQDLIIHSQEVKGVSYMINTEKSIDIDECDIKYKILQHKENERDFKIKILLNLDNLKMIVEGHYEVNEEVEEKHRSKIIAFAGLSALIPFLRYSLLTVTSVTQEGGINLPLIDMQKLISDNTEGENKEKIKKPVTKKKKVSKKSPKK